MVNLIGSLWKTILKVCPIVVIYKVKLYFTYQKFQEKIASLISESFTLKMQSEQLLETAKRAVEIAIEESEEVAMQFINKSQTLN